MNRKTTLLAMSTIALVAGCNRGTANNSANATIATNTAATAPMTPSAPVPAPTAGQPVDAAFLTANPWGRSGNCAGAITFNPDGTSQAPDGDGTWTLEGTTVTVTQNGRAQPGTVSRSGGDMVVTNPTNPGQTMTFTPCPAGAGTAAGE